MTDNKALLQQGIHPDPTDPELPPPALTAWSPRQRDAWESPAMESFRGALRVRPGAEVRDSVLDDLGTHFGMTSEECRRRCLHWEAWSVTEWGAGDRSSPEGIADFYRTMRSWAFDLLWHAYLQAEGYRYPVSVATVRSLPLAEGSRTLDFGSGVGVTAQLFDSLGCRVELADVATSLLDFARFRLERRGVSAGYIDLNADALPEGRYDVITAIDTLAHVPDLPGTVRALHRALKPGGWLFTNFDVRPRTDENAWHLYTDDLPLRWTLHRTGFEPVESLDGQVVRYHRVEPRGPGHAARGARDLVLLRSPLRPTVRRARALLSAARSR
jgi:ubiquinone/menaquinone biosynthesis C-methylase UbiE